MKPLSVRLQAIVDFLRARGSGGATTLEIVTNCKTVATSARISELRKKGFVFETTCLGRNADGAHVWRYVILESSEPVSPQTEPTPVRHWEPPGPTPESQEELWKPGEKRGF